MASEALEKIDRARVMIARLNYGECEWKPSHPPREDDPDMVIHEALRSASLEIARLARELGALRRIAADLHWMARRYVDGRTSYATGLLNTHTRALLAMGVELNPTADGTIWARDGMGRAYDGLSDEEAAQGQRAPEWLHDQDVERLRRELEAARERERRLREAVLDTIRKACRCAEYYRAIEREDPQCQAHDIEDYVEQVFEASG